LKLIAAVTYTHTTVRGSVLYAGRLKPKDRDKFRPKRHNITEQNSTAKKKEENRISDQINGPLDQWTQGLPVVLKTLYLVVVICACIPLLL
jgi:hypothetical protein